MWKPPEHEGEYVATIKAPTLTTINVLVSCLIRFQKISGMAGADADHVLQPLKKALRLSSWLWALRKLSVPSRMTGQLSPT